MATLTLTLTQELFRLISSFSHRKLFGRLPSSE